MVSASGLWSSPPTALVSIPSLVSRTLTTSVIFDSDHDLEESTVHPRLAKVQLGIDILVTFMID